jgi:hypothetical protein
MNRTVAITMQGKSKDRKVRLRKITPGVMAESGSSTGTALFQPLTLNVVEVLLTKFFQPLYRHSDYEVRLRDCWRHIFEFVEIRDQ